jgi:hypothetical protein
MNYFLLYGCPSLKPGRLIELERDVQELSKTRQTADLGLPSSSDGELFFKLLLLEETGIVAIQG